MIVKSSRYFIPTLYRSSARNFSRRVGTSLLAPLAELLPSLELARSVGIDLRPFPLPFLLLRCPLRNPEVARMVMLLT